MFMSAFITLPNYEDNESTDKNSSEILVVVIMTPNTFLDPPLYFYFKHIILVSI